MRDLPRHVRKLIYRAEHHINRDGIIPLDLYAQLMEAGIDVTELERKVRNG